MFIVWLIAIDIIIEKLYIKIIIKKKDMIFIAKTIIVQIVLKAIIGKKNDI